VGRYAFRGASGCSSNVRYSVFSSVLSTSCECFDDSAHGLLHLSGTACSPVMCPFTCAALLRTPLTSGFSASSLERLTRVVE